MSTIPYTVYDYMSMQNMMSAAQDAQEGDPSDTEPMHIDNIDIGGPSSAQSTVDSLTGADEDEGEESSEL